MSQDPKHRLSTRTGLLLIAAAMLTSGLLLALPPGTSATLDRAVWASPSAQTATDKPRLLFFTADWCQPCQGFKQSVLSRDDVTQTLTNGAQPVLVDLTADGEAGQTAEDLANRYAVSAIPTTLLVDTAGQPISRFSGTSTPDRFLAWFNEAIEQNTQTR